MNLRARVSRLERAAADRPPPGRLDILVLQPVRSDPEGRAAGVYLNPPGNVAELVYEGEEPDPGVRAKLEARVLNHGLTIWLRPDPSRAAEGPA